MLRQCKKVLTVFKTTQPVIKPVDPLLIDNTYRYWRIRTMYSIYIGYATFYLTRRSFTFVIPRMLQDLNFTMADIGILGSVFSVTYGLSKFLSGMISDRTNVRYFFSLGLIMTGVANMFFGFSSSLFALTFFLLINGIFQGWGWPSCVRLLTHWYSRSERGTWWGIWNTCHVCGALMPIIAAWSVIYFGTWRAAMFIAAFFGYVIGIFALNRLRNTPELQGLPSIEEYKKDYETTKKVTKRQRSVIDIFLNYVLKNKYIWILAFSYVLTHIVRNSIAYWGTSYLIMVHGYNLVLADTCLSFLEIGGFVGSLAAGWCSDKIFRGMRGQTNVLFSIGIILALVGFGSVSGRFFFMHAVWMFNLGFFIFGPQMLISIAAAELSHKEASGTATGFVGLFAGLGGAVAGYPMGVIIDKFSWTGFFMCVGVFSVMSVLALLPLWRVMSYKARAEEEDLAYID